MLDSYRNSINLPSLLFFAYCRRQASGTKQFKKDEWQYSTWWCFLLLTTSFCTSSRHWKRTGFQSITGKGPSPLLVGNETGQLRVILNLQLALLSQSPRCWPEFFTPHSLELLMNLSFLLRAHVMESQWQRFGLMNRLDICRVQATLVPLRTLQPPTVPGT